MGSTTANNQNSKAALKLIPFSAPRENNAAKAKSERISYNSGLLLGHAALGEKILGLLQSGLNKNSTTVEILYHPKTKLIVEVLNYEPQRIYEKTLTDRNGYSIKVPVTLSENHPDGKLVRFEFETSPRIVIKGFNSPFPLPTALQEEIQSAIELANNKSWAVAA